MSTGLDVLMGKADHGFARDRGAISLLGRPGVSDRAASLAGRRIGSRCGIFGNVEFTVHLVEQMSLVIIEASMRTRRRFMFCPRRVLIGASSLLMVFPRAFASALLSQERSNERVKLSVGLLLVVILQRVKMSLALSLVRVHLRAIVSVALSLRPVQMRGRMSVTLPLETLHLRAIVSYFWPCPRP